MKIVPQNVGITGQRRYHSVPVVSERCNETFKLLTKDVNAIQIYLWAIEEQMRLYLDEIQPQLLGYYMPC